VFDKKIPERNEDSVKQGYRTLGRQVFDIGPRERFGYTPMVTLEDDIQRLAGWPLTEDRIVV